VLVDEQSFMVADTIVPRPRSRIKDRSILPWVVGIGLGD